MSKDGADKVAAMIFKKTFAGAVWNILPHAGLYPYWPAGLGTVYHWCWNRNTWDVILAGLLTRNFIMQLIKTWTLIAMLPASNWIFKCYKKGVVSATPFLFLLCIKIENRMRLYIAQNIAGSGRSARKELIALGASHVTVQNEPLNFYDTV